MIFETGVISEKIFSYLPIEDMPIVMHVCKKWRIIALSQYRNDIVLLLKGLTALLCNSKADNRNERFRSPISAHLPQFNENFGDKVIFLEQLAIKVFHFNIPKIPPFVEHCFDTLKSSKEKLVFIHRQVAHLLKDLPFDNLVVLQGSLKSENYLETLHFILESAKASQKKSKKNDRMITRLIDIKIKHPFLSYDIFKQAIDQLYLMDNLGGDAWKKILDVATKRGFEIPISASLKKLGFEKIY